MDYFDGVDISMDGAAQTQGLGLRDRQAINDAQSASCSSSPPGDHHARELRDGTEFASA
jgi:hypothetical protein